MARRTRKSFSEIEVSYHISPILALPDFSQPFVLEADASGNGIGAVIMQKGLPLAFFNKTLGPKAATASVYEKEAMAILEAI